MHRSKSAQKGGRVNHRRRALPEARYSNYFEVGYNAFEFILDFGQYHPESESARMHTRMVTNPPFARFLAEMLDNAIGRFESKHGAIKRHLDDIDPQEAG